MAANYLSPFRYPGAKARLLSQFREHLFPLVRERGAFCEPFVGGGGVALAVAEEFPDVDLHVNDLDKGIAAFWTVVSGGGENLEALIARVEETVPTVDLHTELREQEDGDLVHRAFRTLFLNRCSFSGILSAGPIGGREQKSKWGVGCRYNAKVLVAKIRRAAELLGGRTKVTDQTFQMLLPAIGEQPALYLDPPYWEKGSQCYPVWMTEDEHIALAKLLREMPNPWVLSYDAAPEVEEMYQEFAHVFRIDASYSMSGADRPSWRDTKELLILGQTCPDS